MKGNAIFKYAEHNVNFVGMIFPIISKLTN
jgi:hypothetical protein